jgi:hypothetical protein
MCEAHEARWSRQYKAYGEEVKTQFRRRPTTLCGTPKTTSCYPVEIRTLVMTGMVYDAINTLPYLASVPGLGHIYR